MKLAASTIYFLAAGLSVVISGTGCGAGQVQRTGLDRSALQVPEAPLLERILGASLPAGSLGEKSAALVSEADRALGEGHTARAFGLLGQAIGALSGDAPPCRARGALLYLRGLVGDLAWEDPEDAGWNELRSTCTRAEVGEEESGFRTFFAYMVPHAGGGDLEGIPWDWMDYPALVATEEADKLEKAAGRLSGRQGEILKAAAAWIRADHMKTDDPCHPSFDQDRRSAFKAASEQFEKAGRSDLALAGRIRATIDEENRLAPQGVAVLLKWAELPENRWLRTQALSKALEFLLEKGVWFDPLLTIPLCQAHLERVREEVAGDRLEGFNGRNASRLYRALERSQACMDHAGIPPLVDDMLAAASESPWGRAGVLGALFGTAVEIFPYVITGEAGPVLHVVIGPLLGGAQRFRGKLGDSDEDRALDAALRVLAAIPMLLQGQIPQAAGEMLAAADTFDSLAAARTGDNRPDILRLVPSLRAGTLILLTGLHHLPGLPPAETAKMQARLDQTLQSDLASLLAYLKAPDHSRALARLVQALPPVVIAAVTRSPQALKPAWKRLEAASAPAEGEQGWWTVGLDGARCLLWDALALGSFGSGSAAKGREALERGAAISQRLIEHALEHFGVRRTGFELLAVIPHLHRALPVVFEKKMEAPRIAAALVTAMEKPLKDAWARVDKGGPDFFADLMDLVAGTHFGRLFTQPRKTMPVLANRIRQKAAEQPPAIQALLEIVAAQLLSHDPRAAHDAFSKAGEAIRQSSTSHIPYLPDLLEASMAFKDQNDLDGALAALDRALADGERGLSCGKQHPAQCLLPFKIWALEVKGQHPEAAKAYELYTSLLRKGFTGDASINFHLRAYRGGFTLNANAQRNLAAGLFFPGKHEGNFNLGMGYDGSHSMLGSQDVMVSYPHASEGPRLDRIIAAHLARAMYAFRQGEERKAHQALLAAVSAGRYMKYGVAVGLNEEARSRARMKLPLPLVTWTSCLARLRGHIHTADQLDWIGRVAGAWQAVGEKDPLPVGEEIPVYLKRLKDLPPYLPLVQAWYQPRDKKNIQSVARHLRKLSRRGSLIPGWGADAAVSLLRSKKPGTLKVPRHPLGKPVVEALNLLVQARTKGKLPKPEVFERITQGLAQAGLYGEIGGLVSGLHAAGQKGNRPQEVQKLVELALKHVPKPEAPLVRADLLALKKEPTLEDLLELVPQIYGRVDPGAAWPHRSRLYTLLIATSRFDELQKRLDTELPVIARTRADTPGYFTMLSVKVALQARKGIVDPEVLRVLARLAGDMQGAEQSQTFLAKLANADNLGAAKDTADKFLKAAFAE